MSEDYRQPEALPHVPSVALPSGPLPPLRSGGLVGLLSDTELRAILLTCDGRGKVVKEQALEMLLNRRFPTGVTDMPADAYLDEEPNTQGLTRSPITGEARASDQHPKT